jgi:hypothetical protein
MKISKETLTIIKSFSYLNQNLLFKKGNVISTKNAKNGQAINTVIGRAEVTEEFPIDFAIYDLKEFLGVIDTFKDPEFIFDEEKNFVFIKEENYSIKYGFANKDSVIYPKKDSQDYTKMFGEFFISAENLKKIKKVGMVLGVKDLVVEGGLTGISMSVCNKNQRSSNVYKVDIEKECSSDFEFHFNIEHLANIIDTDYNCKVVTFNDSLNFILLENNQGLSYYIIHES